MSHRYRHPNTGIGFQQAHAERRGRQVDGTPGFGGLRLVGGVDTVVRRCVGWISRWYRRRTAIRKLQALNDHYLKDIGLDRSQIASSVDEIIETRGQTAARVTQRKQKRW